MFCAILNKSEVSHTPLPTLCREYCMTRNTCDNLIFRCCLSVTRSIKNITIVGEQQNPDSLVYYLRNVCRYFLRFLQFHLFTFMKRVLTRAAKLSKIGKFPAMRWANCHFSQFLILDNTPSSLINYELVFREILHSVRGWRFAAANTNFNWQGSNITVQVIKGRLTNSSRNVLLSHAPNRLQRERACSQSISVHVRFRISTIRKG